MQNLLAEQEMLRSREEQKIRENSDLAARLAEIEKTKANLELEMKSTSARYEQLLKSHNATNNALISHRQTEVSKEHMKS